MPSKAPLGATNLLSFFSTETGAGKEIRTPDLLITSEPALNAVLPDETPGHARRTTHTYLL